jgi:hypothetical protein
MSMWIAPPSYPERRRRSLIVDLNGRALQLSSAFMLAAAVLLPLVPGHLGVICPLRLTLGIPCPLCGMTTSVVATSRGRFSEAVAANPAGIVAVVAAIAILVLRPPRIRVPIGIAVVAVAAMWAYELVRFDIL